MAQGPSTVLASLGLLALAEGAGRTAASASALTDTRTAGESRAIQTSARQ